MLPAIPTIQFLKTLNKKRYIERHQKNENWNNPETAGYLSRLILWNKPTVKESSNDINKTIINMNLNCHKCLFDKSLINSDVLLQKVSNFIIHPELQP